MKRRTIMIVIAVLAALAAVLAQRPEGRLVAPDEFTSARVVTERALSASNSPTFTETISWMEKVCRKLTVSGVQRNACKVVQFTSTAAKPVKLCATVSNQGTSRTGCRVFTVTPKSVPVNAVVNDPVVSLPDAPAGSYAFSDLDVAGNPVRFDVCSVITYQISGTDAEKALTRDAVAELSKTSGLRFREVAYDGYKPLVDALPSTPTARTGLVIRWTNETEVKELAGKVSGIAQSLLWTQGKKSWRSFASIAMDRTPEEDLTRRGGNSAWVVLLHELGHAAGLAHVQDNAQLMFPSTSVNSADSYQAGDLAGLARVGVAATRCK